MGWNGQQRSPGIYGVGMGMECECQLDYIGREGMGWDGMGWDGNVREWRNIIKLDVMGWHGNVSCDNEGGRGWDERGRMTWDEI